MTTINRSALLPYQARQLFELVNDVEAYPNYMDACVGARILRREEALMEARLDLDFNVNSTVLGAAASRLFEKVTNNLVDAVSKRARQVYG